MSRRYEKHTSVYKTLNVWIDVTANPLSTTSFLGMKPFEFNRYLVDLSKTFLILSYCVYMIHSGNNKVLHAMNICLLFS